MSGKLRDRIKDTLDKILAGCNLTKQYKVEVEYPSPLGSVIRESGRRVDIAVLRKEGGAFKPYLYIECKEQNTGGSAQDKLFRALEEARRDRILGVHSIVVFSGTKFSPSYERWAMVEGFIREEYAERWLQRFFCQS